MNILVISTNLFFGGGENFIVNTLTNIKAQLYYIVANNELRKKLNSDNVFMLRNSSFKQKLLQIKNLIDKYHIQTIILNGGSAIYFAPFIKKVNIVIYRHTTNQAVLNPIKRFLYIIILHFCYLYAHKIIAVSMYAYKQQKLFKRKATYIYHGLPILSYQKKSAHTPLRLLFVGRVEKSKGIDIIVKAVSLFKASEVILEIVGQGNYQVPTNIDNVIYRGFSDNVNVFYDYNDIFISLPEHEAFGITFIEAMNHSMPIIACDQGAVSEIIQDNINGFLIQRNVDSLYQIISYIINHKHLIEDMGKKSNLICKQKFDINMTIAKIQQQLIL